MATFQGSPAVEGDDGRRRSTPIFGTDAENGMYGTHSNGTGYSFWVRFPSVTVPQGATINTATITLTAIASAGAGNAVTGDIYGIDEDNHAAPTSDAEWQTDHGIHTTAMVAWDFDVADSGTLVTPDLSTIIQEIVDRASWASGNDMGFHADSDTPTPVGSRIQKIKDVGQGSGGEAVLDIEYSTSTTVNGMILLRVG